MLIVGLETAERIVNQIAARPRDGRRVVGIVDDEPHAGFVPTGCPLLGPLSRLADIVDNIRPDRVVVGLTERRRRTRHPRRGRL